MPLAITPCSSSELFPTWGRIAAGGAGQSTLSPTAVAQFYVCKSTFGRTLPSLVIEVGGLGTIYRLA